MPVEPPLVFVRRKEE